MLKQNSQLMLVMVVMRKTMMTSMTMKKTRWMQMGWNSPYVGLKVWDGQIVVHVTRMRLMGQRRTNLKRKRMVLS